MSNVNIPFGDFPPYPFQPYYPQEAYQPVAPIVDYGALTFALNRLAAALEKYNEK